MRRLGLGLAIEERDIGLASLAAQGTTLPDDVIERSREVDGIILGPGVALRLPAAGTKGGINPSGELRVKLDLFANIRPAARAPGLTILRKPMDLVIVRENTEGFYSDRNMFAGSGEFMPTADIALVDPQGHRQGLGAHRARRLRAAPAPAQEGHGRAQGQRASSSPTGCSCARCARSPRSTRTSSSTS